MSPVPFWSRAAERRTGLSHALQTSVATLLTVTGLVLAPVVLRGQEEQTDVAVTVLLPGERTSEASEGEPEVSLPTATGSDGLNNLQRAGAVTATIRELSVVPTSTEQASFLLFVRDDRGTATGWEVNLHTEPAGVLGLLVDRTDTIALVYPQPVFPRTGGGVVNGRYVGPIAAGSVPLLVAPVGYGDGVWTQPLEVGLPDAAEASPVEVVVLVLNLAFAP